MRLVGRDQELSALRVWCEGEGAGRLIMCGPPGIGKSALLAALGAALGARAWLIDCAQLSTLDQLCIALSARRGWDGPPALRLSELEAELPPVILLDHAEGLRGALSQLDAPRRWLIAAQQIEPGEQVIRLGGLDDVAARQLVGAPSSPSLDALLTCCEGSPLALHIVSRRLLRMSAEELLERLEAGALLTAQAPDAPRSMAQIIGFAWARLDPALREAWAACAAWGEPFSLADAELVAPGSMAGWLMCDALEALEAASLLEHRAEGWHMAESLRLFARREAPAQVEAAEQRMAEGLTALACEQARRVREHDDVEAQRALQRRQLTLMRLLERVDGAWRPRLLHALMSLLAEQGMFAAIVRWVDALAGPLRADTLTLELHLNKALATAFIGDVAGALAQLARLEPWTRADAQAAMYHDYTHGLLRSMTREHEAARELLERALEQSRAQGNTRLICRALTALGNCWTRQQRWGEALEAYDAAIEAAQQASFMVSAMQTRSNRAAALVAMGRIEEAIITLEQIAASDEAHNRLRNLCVTLGNLGAAYLAVGALDEAASALDRALSLSYTQREPRTLCIQLMRRAQVALAQGAHEAASAWLERLTPLIDGQRAPGLVAEHHLTRALHHLLGAQEVQARGWLARYEAAPYEELDYAARALRAVMAGARLEAPPEDAFAPLEHLLWRRWGAALPSLRVARDGSGFQLDDAAPVSLGRSGAGRRILASMAERAEAAPDEVIDAWTLFEAGWPDQVGVPSSGLSRLYTAINRLRGAGLEPVLETAPDGYRLRARVRCVPPDAL